MPWENVLLLFEEGYPCWTAETVTKAGEDPKDLKTLENLGFLERTCGETYQLTSEGRERFIIQAGEYFFDARPATPSADPGLDLRRLELKQLLDASFLGRWGLKKFFPGKKVLYYPGLPTEKVFREGEGAPLWLYPDSQEIKAMDSRFPLGRKADPDATPEDIHCWMAERNIARGIFETDLLLLHYCDFEYYMHVIPPATDTEKFLHCDRFFFQLARKNYFTHPSELYDFIGRFHLLLFYYRHLGLPGSFDLDIHQQENISVIIFVTDTEKEAEEFYGIYHPAGEELMGPARPMEIEVISLEALKGIRGREESHFDLLEKIGHRIAITYPPGG